VGVTSGLRRLLPGPATIGSRTPSGVPIGAMWLSVSNKILVHRHEMGSKLGRCGYRFQIDLIATDTIRIGGEKELVANEMQN
jgi:hypothetical protein